MILEKAKRLVIVVIGSTLLVIGVALIFLPGPAFLVIPLSLALLGTEFIWARRLMIRLKKETRRVQNFLGFETKDEEENLK